MGESEPLMGPRSNGSQFPTGTRTRPGTTTLTGSEGACIGSRSGAPIQPDANWDAGENFAKQIDSARDTPQPLFLQPPTPGRAPYRMLCSLSRGLASSVT